MRVIGTWGVSMAARLTPLASGALATRGFAFAHALQHFAARGFGCSGHDLSAGRATGTAPNGLPAHGNGLSPFFGFRAEPFDLNNGDVLFGEGFNGLHKAFFIQAHQAHGFACLSRTAGSANAVHVVFADVWNFIIHDVRQVVDVDATGRNVGRHQGANFATLKTLQSLGAGTLALVSVQRHGLNAVFRQELSDVVGAKLGAREHQHLAPVVLLDDVGQQGFLFAAAHRMDHLADALHGGVARRYLNALRVFQQGGSEFANFVAEGGREQQALFFFGHQRQNLFDVVDEAHVQHAVGFVKHQHLHAGQIQEALLLQVQQATRGGHQNVHAFFQLGDLRVHADATKNHRRGELEVFAVVAHRLFHLSRQFAGGGQDENAHAGATVFGDGAARHGQLVQHGQGEGRCFAGAGLGPGQ